jgi:hypothetical protein
VNGVHQGVGRIAAVSKNSTALEDLAAGSKPDFRTLLVGAKFRSSTMDDGGLLVADVHKDQEGAASKSSARGKNNRSCQSISAL